MAFTFIHTGDLHLDSPLTGLSAHQGEDGDKAKIVAGAGRAAFRDLVDLAIEERVDAMLIAGDLWDGDWRDLSAGLFMQAETSRLAKAGVRTFAILGNHDAESRVTDRIRHLDALHLFSSDAPSSVECGPAVIHGQSYREAATTENLAARYPRAWPGRINVGLLHTALDGSFGHGRYAPCTLADLAARQYDYWALGHVHERRILQERRAADGGVVAFCGVLQGRHIGESGPKGAYLGHIDENGPHLRPIDLPHAAWFVAEADLSRGEAPEPAIRRAVGRVAEGLAPALRCAVIRVRVTGETARHFSLANSLRALTDTARQIAAGIDDRLLIEEVNLQTRPPVDRPAPHLPHNFEAVIARAAASEEVAQKAAAEVREVLSLLPGPVKAKVLARMPLLLPFDETGSIEPLLADAAEAVTALAGGEEE
ncbi:metallophosphoesterase family protein [Acuticoccus mangrovi]|uniref:DNA repair exonuclease n=1 Tax=Acuticoccus mangrovi TaxID=2796142 RepID=A0A934MGL4_9HYPH|nr:DNA repair exonuclease [Acuticoccus mangrovi]MBJ3776713.1 DNA repair exonuclease [Acuticoccus mangrovi]